MSYRPPRPPSHHRRPARYSGEDQRGLDYDDPVRHTPPFVESRPPHPSPPEPWGDARFTHDEPQQRYRGPDVPGPHPPRSHSNAYDPPDESALFVGRPPPPWPASEDPNWSRPPERTPTYRDGMMSRANWEALIDRQFPDRPGPGDNFPLGDPGGDWPTFGPDPSDPAPEMGYVPMEPSDMFRTATAGAIESPQFPGIAAPAPEQPMFSAPEPTLEARLADPMQDLQHGFAPAMPEPLDPGLSFAPFPEPPEPFGGLEQRLMEPPPLDPYPFPAFDPYPPPPSGFMGPDFGGFGW